jgi:hypothetical protein
LNLNEKINWKLGKIYVKYNFLKVYQGCQIKQDDFVGCEAGLEFGTNAANILFVKPTEKREL